MTLSLLLIPLFIFLVVFILFAVSAFYHVIRFELLNVATLTMTAIFIAGTFAIGSFAMSYISQIDWNEPIVFTLFETLGPSQNQPSKNADVLTF